MHVVDTTYIHKAASIRRGPCKASFLHFVLYRTSARPELRTIPDRVPNYRGLTLARPNISGRPKIAPFYPVGTRAAWGRRVLNDAQRNAIRKEAREPAKRPPSAPSLAHVQENLLEKAGNVSHERSQPPKEQYRYQHHQHRYTSAGKLN